MPVIRDNKGNVYAIPSTELQKYKVTEAEANKLAPPTPGRDSDDVELQGRYSSSQVWYSGD